MLGADLSGSSLELGRTEIVRRRVDEVAAEEQSFGKREQAGPVDTVGQHQALRLDVVLSLVATEAVRPGKPGKRGKLGIGKLRGEAIVAGRERARQGARKQWRLCRPILVANAKQGAANAATFIGQEQDSARFWRPAPRFEPIPLDFAQALQARVVLGGDEPDGIGLAPPCEQ